MIKNYRVNFGGEDIDYKDNFKDCRKYFPVLEKLYDRMNHWAIPDCWHFFEPYVEFTWVLRDNDPSGEDILYDVLDILTKENIEPTLIHKPKDGVIVDWYCKSPEEQEFGYKTYALSAKMAMLFWKHQEAIAKGCGEKNQYMRRPHVLANQIGMNYDEECAALYLRSKLAGLFWELGDHAQAVEQYETLTGETYL